MCCAAIIIGLVALFAFTKVACVVTIIPIAFLCMIFGYLSKRFILGIGNKRAVILGAGSLILFAIFVILNRTVSNSSLDMSSLNLGFAPFYIFSTLFGSVAVCAVSMLISRVKFTKTVIFIGTYSLYFYGFHYEILGLISSFIKNPYLVAAIALLALLPIVYAYIKIKSKIEGKLNDKRNCSGLQGRKVS